MNTRPTTALIDRAAIESNLAELRNRLERGVRVMAVVKANAYGHGDVEVARTLASSGADCFGVATPSEGERLREAGITAPVVVLAGLFPDQVKEVFDFDLTPVVYDMETLKGIDAVAASSGVRKKVHVKIDTGMGRLGIRPTEIGPFFEELGRMKNVAVEGVMSHLVESESEDKAFTREQTRVFGSSVEAVRTMGFSPELVHLANSAGIVEHGEAHFNMVRPGIMLYGSYPSPRLSGSISLRPAMTLATRILYLKKVPPGSPLGYNRTFVTRRESLIATLAIGYGDGLSRSLSSRGSVIVRGQRAPIVGTVCMDLTLADVTGVPGVAAGDEAIVIGAGGGERITAEEVARLAGTISYEVFCNVSQRVPRVYA